MQPVFNLETWNGENSSSFIPTPHPERLFLVYVTLVNGHYLLLEVWNWLMVAAGTKVL